MHIIRWLRSASLEKLLRSCLWPESDRQQPCATRNDDPTPGRRTQQAGSTRASASPPISRGAADGPTEPAQWPALSPEPWLTKQRLAEHLSVTPRWSSFNNDAWLPHPHTLHEPLPHLGGRNLAARGVRLAASPVDGFCRAAPRAPPLSSFSSPFAALRGPTANRGERFRLALVCGFRGFCGLCAVANQGPSRVPGRPLRLRSVPSFGHSGRRKGREL